MAELNWKIAAASLLAWVATSPSSVAQEYDKFAMPREQLVCFSNSLNLTDITMAKASLEINHQNMTMELMTGGGVKYWSLVTPLPKEYNTTLVFLRITEPAIDDDQSLQNEAFFQINEQGWVYEQAEKIDVTVDKRESDQNSTLEKLAHFGSALNDCGMLAMRTPEAKLLALFNKPFLHANNLLLD